MTPVDTTGLIPQPSLPWPAPRSRAALLCLGALLLGIGATAVLARTANNATLGYLEADSAEVIANVAGRIEEIAVAEGTRVEPGQKILVVVDEALESQIAELKKRVDLLHKELEQARAKADIDLKWRMKELEAEILETRLKSTGLMQVQFDHEIETFAWTDLLNESLLAEPDSLFKLTSTEMALYPIIQPAKPTKETRVRAMIEQESARNAQEVSKAQVELCDARLKELEALKQDLPVQIARSQGVQLAEARLAEATEELTRVEGRPKSVEIVATMHGTVGIYKKAKGERVAAGESIVMLLDEEQRFLSVQIPSRRAPQFPAGSIVNLEFPGGHTRAGRVRTAPPQAIAKVPMGTDAQDSFVPLRIDPVQKLWPDMPIGAAVEVRPGK
ncbi:MAG: HlyD family secretion protein [Planctomycetaceae bacterium]